MKKFLLLLVCLPVFGSQQVSYHSQVVSALSPHVQACYENVAFHNDLVVNLVAGYQNTVFAVVSEPQYSNYNQVVAFIGNQFVAKNNVVVLVENNALRRFNLVDFNQTVVSCVQKVVNNGKVVAQKIVKQVRFVGLLQGNVANQVKQFVAACR